MTSFDCLEMKEKYESVKTKIQGVIVSFDDCSNSIMETSSFLQDLIVCGKTFDDGKLEDDNTLLGIAKNNLQSIIEECNEKIDFYEKKYKEELTRERALEIASSEDSGNDGSSVNTSLKPNDNTIIDVR